MINDDDDYGEGGDLDIAHTLSEEDGGIIMVLMVILMMTMVITVMMSMVMTEMVIMVITLPTN